jgi:hypothetical protein
LFFHCEYFITFLLSSGTEVVISTLLLLLTLITCAQQAGPLGKKQFLEMPVIDANPPL